MTNFMIVKTVVVVVALVSSAANAFGPVTFGVSRPSTRTRGRISMSALFYSPRHMDRAIECASHYGTCKIEELENLTNELSGVPYNEFQDANEWQEINSVKRMLEVQTKLSQMTHDYENEIHHHHHDSPETYDLADIF